MPVLPDAGQSFGVCEHTANEPMIEEGTIQEFKRSILAELPALPKVGEIWRTEIFTAMYNLQIDRIEQDFKRGWCVIFGVINYPMQKDAWYRLPLEDFMERIDTGKATRIQ